jgi:hypothetical protein
VELERLELQLFELLEQPALLVPGEELGLIPEAGRKIGHFRRRSKSIQARPGQLDTGRQGHPPHPMEEGDIRGQKGSRGQMCEDGRRSWVA